MNSSVLNDPIFVKEIEEVFQGLQDMHITDPLEWWDLFIMVVQGTTMAYTKRKAKIKHGLKRFLTEKLETYEKLHNLTMAQNKTYLYYKSRLRDLLQDQIRGHEIRT